MKWLEEVYGLFVDDPKLVLMAVVSLAVALAVGVGLGWHKLAGAILFLMISGSIFVSVERH